MPADRFVGDDGAVHQTPGETNYLYHRTTVTMGARRGVNSSKCLAWSQPLDCA
jgi:hypothetical protein